MSAAGRRSAVFHDPPMYGQSTTCRGARVHIALPYKYAYSSSTSDRLHVNGTKCGMGSCTVTNHPLQDFGYEKEGSGSSLPGVGLYSKF